MNSIIIPETDINIAIVNSLIDNNWLGEWSIKDNKIFIQCDNFDTLDNIIKKKKFNYNDALYFVSCMGIILSYIIPLNKSFLFLSLQDITVIDEKWYIINNDNNIVNIIDNDNVILETPIKIKEKMLPPEIKNINSLPFVTNVSCIYYSIALLTIYCMNINFNSDLSEIYDTKLYFFLKRCLLKDPEKRFYILI
tara:strand:- start:3792 stop:4373 length:582 start_codon:yes stop_codon:yes gene_type:complete